MGQGIAQVAAAAGHATRALRRRAGARARRRSSAIAAQLEKLVAKGKMHAEDARRRRSRACPRRPTRPPRATGADVVIEAVPEDMELKVALFEEVVRAAPPRALVASNTSSLSITELGARIGAPDRTVGLHFFNPPPVMELARGRARPRDDATRHVERALAFAQGARQDADRRARRPRLRDEPARRHPRRRGDAHARDAAWRARPTSIARWSSATATRWARSS